MAEQDDHGGEKSEQGSLVIEWVVGWASAVLLTCLIGYLVFLGLVEQAQTPDLRLATRQVVETDTGFNLTFGLSNHSRKSVAQVEVEATAENLQQPLTATFDYVPAGSERRATFVFPDDPRDAGLSLKVTGYQEP